MKKYMIFVFMFFLTFLLVACNNNEPSLEDLSEQIKGFSSYKEVDDYFTNLNSDDRFDVSTDDALTGAPEKGEETNDNSDTNYSKTNVQVEGVSEIDNIITDGQFIYMAKYQVLRIIDVESMEIIFEQELSHGYFNGIYLYDDHLVALYHQYKELSDKGVSDSESIWPDYYWRGGNSLNVDVYDVSNKKEISLKRELDFENTSLSDSRMVEGQVYLMMSTYGSYLESEEEMSNVPRYRDTMTSLNFQALDYRNIYYIEGNSIANSYFMVGTFSVRNQEEIDLNAYIGYGFEVYMNHKNLYVAGHKYHYDKVAETYELKTLVMRFEIINKLPVFKASTEINGLALNQFSFDEYQGVLRVAVTDYDYSKAQNQVSNHLYLLDATDSKLSTISRLDGLGKPGERIYAVRMNGDTAYVVTFVNVDPLYKIDLSDPKNPQILGEWEEEGVSDYLHQINDDLMIGIGREAEESNGITTFTGVKVALYDTSGDAPLALETLTIIGEYSYSPLQYNHKLYVEYEWNDTYLFAIPVYVINDDYQYHQAIYLYQVNALNELVEFGFLTGDLEFSYYYGSIEKAIFIGDSVYTISYRHIMEHDLNDNLAVTDTLIFDDMNN